MVRVLLTALIFAITIAPLQAFAKKPRVYNSSNDSYLIDKLVEKGVITAEEAEELADAKKDDAKTHSLNIDTRLQFLYTYQDYARGSGNEDTSDVTIRRLRVTLSGNMYKGIDYKLELAGDKLKDISMKDAWFGVKHIKYARLRVGQFKTPFSRQRMTSSSKLQIINRSPVELLYPGRDIGVEISGKNIGDVFDYGVAIMSGAGDKFKFQDTDNRAVVAIGRVAVHPIGEIKFSEGNHADSQEFNFEIAGNFLAAPNQIAYGEKGSDKIFNALSVFGVADLASMPRGDIYVAGPELSVAFKGFSLSAEGYFAHFAARSADFGKITTGRRNVQTMGYFVQSGFFIVPQQVEIVGRFDQLNVDMAQEDDKQDFRSITGGLNYFVSSSHKYKVQANYIRTIHASTHSSRDNNKIEVNTQVSF